MLLAALLLAVCASFMTYRVVWLGYPLLPTVPAKAWKLSMQAHLKPDPRGVTLKVGFPATEGNQMVMEETITSGSLRFTLERKAENRIGVWTGNPGADGEVVGYQATVLIRPREASGNASPALGPYPMGVSLDDQQFLGRLVSGWTTLPSPQRIRTIGHVGAGELETGAASSQDVKAWSVFREKHGRISSMLALFRAAGFPARAAQGFVLEESVMSAPIQWVEVWNGFGRERLSSDTGAVYPASLGLFALTRGGTPSAEVSGGPLPDVRWSMSREILAQWRVLFERIRRSSHLLDRWSLFSLPPEFQTTFRIFLLVPIGALMICVLRNMIGFPTFGIFMPVLMALAFRNTGLSYGLAIFAGIVLLGYLVRRLIDRLHLLLVPRLSVILTLVIGCFTIFALIGGKTGLRAFMAVGLLPFVILTMTIERFYVVIEESGVREGMRNAAGSAAVAAITYGILQVEWLQLIFFIYPELLLAVGAFQLLIGRYTGYRLSEVIRFRSFKGAQ
jgi:hypothetical protein